uniref:Uncharacterized protein n=1 Tax=Arundo donax TaxID=35708 RepID=A0A0A9AN81_ARUDO
MLRYSILKLLYLRTERETSPSGCH